MMNRYLKILVHAVVINIGIFTVAHSADKHSGVGKTRYAIAYLAFAENYWQVFLMNMEDKTVHQLTTSKYDKSKISWYPDAKHILVNSNDGSLYELDINSGQERALNSIKRGMLDAVISPTGRYIAFSLMDPDNLKNFNLWIMGVDGKAPHQLTNMKWLQHQPAWSANGEWLYFLSGKGSEVHDIWRISLLTQEKEKITQGNVYHFDVALSHNDEIAYSGNSSGNYEIWVGKLHEQPRKITDNEQLDANPSWSPDGEMIVFDSAANGVSNIWIMDKHGKNKVQLTENKIGARAPVWAPYKETLDYKEK